MLLICCPPWVFLLLFFSYWKEAQATGGCKTYFFQERIHVDNLGDCSVGERRRIGELLNQVIDDAFKNVDFVTTGTKVCKHPERHSNADDDDNGDDDGSDYFDCSADDDMIGIKKQPRRKLKPRSQRGLFVYVAGGYCRLCGSDNSDKRRRRQLMTNEGSKHTLYSVSAKETGQLLQEGSSSGRFGNENTSDRSYESKSTHKQFFLAYTSSTKWPEIKRYLENSLNQFLTTVIRSTHSKRRGHCLYGTSPNVNIEIIRKLRRRDANPQCAKRRRNAGKN